MFIQTEPTPDASRLRFIPGCEVLAQGSVDLSDKAQSSVSPLAERLFAIPGVTGVSFSKDAITVTKVDGDWQHLKPAILGAIMEHFRSGAPVIRIETGIDGSRSSLRPAGGHADTIGSAREALRQVIDPELGYNIVDLGLVYDIAVEEAGVVCITMTTTTPGCPATDYLKRGAREAASRVSEVESVEVRLTYEPRWTPEMMNPEAKAHFGMGRSSNQSTARRQ
jgi:metal-sulfur cluster biosynthetic enzyme